MKITIITAVFNRVEMISSAIRSVQSQNYSSVEHVIIDGSSSDGTVECINLLSSNTTVLISEPDEGIYDALNKGLAISSGEIIGLLHSDDFFADQNILTEIAKVFSDPTIGIVYGDLDYVDRFDVNRTIRRWRSDAFTSKSIGQGWMPPHPTLFIRRSLIEGVGRFDLAYRISADYDLILRLFAKKENNSAYLAKVLVKMRVGGESNKSILAILRKSHEDFCILRKNNFSSFSSFYILFLKNISKIKQFF
ncbi:glycosyltransferase family 2 protein [Polynucleobacter paneuropaeus]|uniref:glycosyltransferase family 2 protein n=1 Tax=Polynucleobacter paneuropaeus TaxID=2527775 RepID=UPI001C33404C|nr:glycosyltransferase family 2 protein [Polynucleobacter paneuropaeus]MBT8634574.1 glycosyltransferase [Polynucleobacter paneuropaeus]QWD51304.1 glycosyltransferase [Polynucleobacter paneuropaeus]QWD54519.1 glycosyltransferase [Polynucleobacter paneuropaeus]QWD56226.1 glycosyltransferase [Polynucleobacter paneuropaeus]